MSVRLKLQAVPLMPPVLTHLAALSAHVMKGLWEMGALSVATFVLGEFHQLSHKSMAKN